MAYIKKTKKKTKSKTHKKVKLQKPERKRLTKAERLEIFHKASGRCQYCGIPMSYKDMQVDHIVPLHNGGENTEENYRAACRMCNYYKNTLSVEKLRNELNKLPERLGKDFAFRLAMRYGLIVVCKDKEIVFEFEKEDNKQKNTPN